MDVNYADADAAATANHNWHVHANGGIDTTDCATAGGHWDPDGVEVQPAYSDNAQCTSDDEYANCYKGDLSGILGQISIGTANEPMAYSAATEADLQGKSIVIHAADGGAPRVACADILVVTTPAPASGSSDVRSGSRPRLTSLVPR